MSFRINTDNYFKRGRFTHVLALPIFDGFPDNLGVTGEPGFEGNVMFNNSASLFYGHDGSEWVPFGGGETGPTGPSGGPTGSQGNTGPTGPVADLLSIGSMEAPKILAGSGSLDFTLSTDLTRAFSLPSMGLGVSQGCTFNASSGIRNITSVSSTGGGAPLAFFFLWGAAAHLRWT